MFNVHRLKFKRNFSLLGLAVAFTVFSLIMLVSMMAHNDRSAIASTVPAAQLDNNFVIQDGYAGSTDQRAFCAGCHPLTQSERAMEQMAVDWTTDVDIDAQSQLAQGNPLIRRDDEFVNTAPQAYLSTKAFSAFMIEGNSPHLYAVADENGQWSSQAAEVSLVLKRPTSASFFNNVDRHYLTASVLMDALSETATIMRV